MRANDQNLVKETSFEQDGKGHMLFLDHRAYAIEGISIIWSQKYWLAGRMEKVVEKVRNMARLRTLKLSLDGEDKGDG